MSIDEGKNEWSIRQWVAATTGVFVFQVLLVFALSRREFGETRIPGHDAPSRLAMVMGAAREEGIMAGVGRIDPALFAVAHRSGFSARASLVRSAGAPALTSLMEPPSWLQGSVGLFDPVSGTEGIRDGGQRSGFTTVERPSSDFSNLGTASGTSGVTVVRLSGGLARRAILRGATAPVLASPQVVRSSVVQLGVDGDGFVHSARLLDSSGWAAADQEALKHARRMRFQHETGTNRTAVLDWGNVAFPWQISGAASTDRSF